MHRKVTLVTNQRWIFLFCAFFCWCSKQSITTFTWPVMRCLVTIYG